MLLSSGSSASQVQLIKSAFEESKKKSLKSVIDSAFSGIMETALNALLLPSRYHFLAQRLKQAMDGIGTNTTTVARVLGTHDKADCQLIMQTYKEISGMALSDSLSDELSGDLLKVHKH
jgi:annexin A7/11